MAEKAEFSAAIPIALALVLASIGCQNTGGGANRASRITPTYNRDTGRLERITYDRNGDGKVDAWTVMSGTVVVRAEFDENYDGLVDRWEFYAPGSQAGRAGAPTPPTRVEKATRGDGKVSRWEFYTGGVLTRAEEDTDGNGRVDKWETWQDGALAAIALDTTGRGRPDRRIVYAADGPRIEVADAAGSFRPAAPAGDR